MWDGDTILSHFGHVDIMKTTNYGKSDMRSMNSPGGVWMRWVEKPLFLLSDGVAKPVCPSGQVEIFITSSI